MQTRIQITGHVRPSGGQPLHVFHVECSSTVPWIGEDHGLTVRVEIQGDIGLLTLDRPEKAHAYDSAMLDALEAAIVEWEQQPVRALVVQASGDGAFCGGADLDELRTAVPADAENLRSQALFDRLARLPAVSIAAVHGAAVAGGCELALACDLRVVGPRARFALPETQIGLIPSAGGCTRLQRLIGVSRSKAVILGGAEIGADDAINWGLAHRLAADPRAEAVFWARQIARMKPEAIAAAKRVLDAEDLSPSLARERQEEAVLYRLKQQASDGSEPQ